MIAILVVVFAVLCFALLRRYQSREHKNELLTMKRHAASYMEQHKRL
jgi:preprotein translocase subunit YajC